MESKIIQTVIELKDKLSQPMEKTKKVIQSFNKEVEKVKKSIVVFQKKAVVSFNKVVKKINQFKTKTKKNFKVVIKKLGEFKNKSKASFLVVGQKIGDFKNKTKRGFKIVGVSLKLFARNVKKRFSSSSKHIKAFKAKSVASLKAVGEFAKKAASAGFDFLKKGIGDCLSEAKKMNDAQTKLSAIFQTTGKATSEEVAALNAHAKALQDTGVVGEGVTTSFQSQLATYNLTADSVKQLSAGAMDLVAQMNGVNATQENGVDVGNMLGSVLNGQTDALKGVGISFSAAQEDIIKYGTEQEKVAMLSDVLGQKVGGMNESLAQTPSGKIAALQNRFNSLKATIGNKLLPIQGKLADWFMKHMPEIEKVVQSVFDGIERAAEYLKPKLEDIKEWLKNAFESEAMDNFREFLEKLKSKMAELGEKAKEIANFIVENWSFIGPIIYGIIGAFIAFKAVMLGIGIVQTFMSAVNPIGLVVLAIGTLIGIGIALYKNWDTIKLKVAELWGKFQEFIGGITEKFPLLGVIIETTVEQWKEVFEGVKEIFTGVIDFVKGVFTGDWEMAWDGVKQVFEGVFNTLTGIAKAPINGIIDLMNMLIEKINGFSFKLPDWIPGELGGMEFSMNIPSIPPLALGSKYTSKGMYEIHDGPHGGEIVGLPNGSTVIPADKSKMLLGGSGVVVNVAVNGNVIGNKAFIEQVGYEVASKVRNAIYNM